MTRTARMHVPSGRTLLITLLVVVMAVGGFARPATAAAAAGSDPVGVHACQADSARFTLVLAGGTRLYYYCSGSHPVGATASRFEAGGWSGIVHYNASSNWAFCDWEKWNIPYYVRKVELYATKASWC